MDQQHILVDPLNIPEVLPSTSGVLQVGDEAAASTSLYQQSDMDSSESRMTMSSRRTNFRQEERDALVSLVAEYMGLIDGSHSSADGGTPHGRRQVEGLRAKAWQEISARFNNNPNFLKRDVHQLRKCWMNMKTRSQFTLPQRRLLGLDSPMSVANKYRMHGKRSKSRSGLKTRTPTASGSLIGASRYHSLKQKTSLSRVNRPSSVLNRVRPRSNTSYFYRQAAMLSKPVRKPQPEVIFDLTREVNYQEQPAPQGMSLAGSRVQFLPDTLTDRSPVDHGVSTRFSPQGLSVMQRSTAQLPQTGTSRIAAMLQTDEPIAVQRTTRSPETQSRLMHSLDSDLMVLPLSESGAHGQMMSLQQQQQQHQQQQQQQRFIRNVNRTRPANAQLAATFSHLDPALTQPTQISPPCRLDANTIHVVGDYLGTAEDVQLADTNETTFTIEDEDENNIGHFTAADANFSRQQLSTTEVNDVNAMSGTMSLALQQTTPNASMVVDNSSGGRREMEALSRPRSSEQRTLHESVSRITNSTGVASSKTPTSSNQDSSNISEVEIVIKTETEDDVADISLKADQPTTVRALVGNSSPRESDYTASYQPSKDTGGSVDTHPPVTRSTCNVDNAKPTKRTRLSDTRERQELHPVREGNSNFNSEADCDRSHTSKTPSKERRQREVNAFQKERNVESADGMSGDTNEFTDDLDRMDDDNVENDDGFIETDTQSTADVVGILRTAQDNRYRIKNRRNKRLVAVDVAAPIIGEDSVERKARMDILLFDVQKAKEEAAMARCRRELLEVEVESARQQMQLTRQRQEVEIELMRERVRQERAKADQLVGSCLSESENLHAAERDLPTASTELRDSEGDREA